MLVMLLIKAFVLMMGTSQILHLFYVPAKIVVLPSTSNKFWMLMLPKLLTKQGG